MTWKTVSCKVLYKAVIILVEIDFGTSMNDNHSSNRSNSKIYIMPWLGVYMQRLHCSVKARFPILHGFIKIAC
jgi:hypothetical protein